MKTEGSLSSSIWAGNVELPHITTEELTVIENCQVSSILSNLNENNCTKASDIRLFDVSNTGDVILNLAKSEPTKNYSISLSKRKGINFVACGLCPYLCLTEKQISDHMEFAHKNGEILNIVQYHCPTCQNVFYHKTSLQIHLIYDHNVAESDLNVILQVCMNEDYIEVIDDEKSIDDNVLVNNDYLMQDDKLVEPVPEDTSVHLPTVDLSEDHTEKMFSDYIKQNSVSKMIEDKLFHKCPMCKVKIQDPEKMRYHIRCHKESYFECIECYAAFSFWNPLSVHLWRTHKIDMELHACDKCDYKSSSLSKLNNIHKAIHNEYKSYSCELCSKTFKNIKQLRNHRSTHKKKIDNTTYSCEICSKEFYERRQLRVHIDSVHKKLKPFLCSYCGYKASTKSTLKMHIRQHTGEKPFSCDSCDYVTSDHNSLRRHKLRHSGFKPYKCQYCDYGCIQSSTFKSHIKRKHPNYEAEELFSCPECSFKTIKKESVDLHVKSVHCDEEKAELV